MIVLPGSGISRETLAALRDFKVDVAAASEAFVMLPGRIAVEMLPKVATQDGIILTDRSGKRYAAAVGRVISRPFGGDMDVSFGEAVICHPQDGKRVNGLAKGKYQARGEVRFFGTVCPRVGEIKRMPWYESVLGVIDLKAKDVSIRAVGRNVLLRLQPKTDRPGLLFVPDNLQDREDVAEVISVGRLVKSVKVGDTVLYERRALTFMNVEGDKNLAFTHISENEDAGGIYCVVRDLAKTA